MRVRVCIALAGLIFAAAACSSGGTAPSSSLDAGAPPHPLEFEFEGLTLGAAKEAVVDAWGPPSFEGMETIEYANRGAFANVQLRFKSVPLARNVQPEAVREAGDDRPIEFLTAIILTPAERRGKEEIRPQLVSLYGEPLAVSALAGSPACASSRCEVFRPGECALLRVDWEPAPAGAVGRETAASLCYVLAPDSLITEIPRTLWLSLRGAIAPAPPADLEARLGRLRTGERGSRLDEVVKIMGLPNLVITSGRTVRSLHYFWLDNASVKLSLDGDVLRSVSSSS